MKKYYPQYNKKTAVTANQVMKISTKYSEIYTKMRKDTQSSDASSDSGKATESSKRVCLFASLLLCCVPESLTIS